MPNCIQFISKETGEPESFAKIDDTMRADFGIAPDPERYLASWYDIISFGLAMGNSWQQLEENQAPYPITMRQIAWLKERYEVRTWAEIGRR